MRKFYLLLLLGVVACTQQPADQFVLRGTVPGAIDSTEVTLRIVNEWGKALDTAYVVEGTFELRGKVEAPVLCRLTLDNSAVVLHAGQDMNQVRRYELDFFVEHGKLSFAVPHIDSLPQAYWKYDVRKEKYYRVKGSATQDAYYRYQQQTLPLRYDIQLLRRQGLQIPDYHSRMKSMEGELDAMGKAFIRSNSNLVANLYVAEKLKKPAFMYDQAYLDELKQLFVSCPDTCAALKNFRQYLQDASRFVYGSPVPDAELATLDGKSVSLLEQMNPNGYTFIDFWASWCLPCRMSLIHLREVYKQYQEKVRFVSISIDQKKEDWQKAVEEEKLPWLQLYSSPEQTECFVKQYNLLGIPAFFLIDSNGRIVFSAANSSDVAIQLDKLLQ